MLHFAILVLALFAAYAAGFATRAAISLRRRSRERRLPRPYGPPGPRSGQTLFWGVPDVVRNEIRSGR